MRIEVSWDGDGGGGAGKKVRIDKEGKEKYERRVGDGTGINEGRHV